MIENSKTMANGKRSDLDAIRQQIRFYLVGDEIVTAETTSAIHVESITDIHCGCVILTNLRIVFFNKSMYHHDTGFQHATTTADYRNVLGKVITFQIIYEDIDKVCISEHGFARVYSVAMNSCKTYELLLPEACFRQKLSEMCVKFPEL
jgi:hypothetical protein